LLAARSGKLLRLDVRGSAVAAATLAMDATALAVGESARARVGVAAGNDG
jgi:hypothetical protein